MVKYDLTWFGLSARDYLFAALQVVRDRLMDAADKTWPQYGFAAHKGYGTPAHVAALKVHGPCVLHRRSFAPLRTWLAAESQPADANGSDDASA